MDSGFWVEIAKGLVNRRGVTTLMALTGRSIWVLGSIAIATLASSGNELTSTRLWVLCATGVAYVLLHLVAYGLGMCWPKRFHYGAQELIKQEEMGQQSKSPAGEIPDANVPGPTGPTGES